MLPLRTDADHKLLSDSALISRIVSGDTCAFELVMRRYNRALYRTARSIVKDDAEAEDTLQDAYMQAYQSMARFRGESRLLTWLTRIVVNQAVARLRKSAARRAEVISLDGGMDYEQPAAEAAMSIGQSESPDSAAMRAETRRLLERKIDELPEAFRTVFVLRALEEMTVEEVSAVLRIPEATVRTRYFRSRSMLREALSRELDFTFEDAFSFDGERCDRIVAGVMKRLLASGKDAI
jgi:RNA polymerase sigma-70 factor, ECF subfamily